MADKVIETVAEIGRSVAGGPGRLTTCVGPPCYSPGAWDRSRHSGLRARPTPRSLRRRGAVKPIRWILQTTLAQDHQGGTPKIAAAGVDLQRRRSRPSGGQHDSGHCHRPRKFPQADDGDRSIPEEAWPTETYYIPSHKLSQYINGEGIQLYHVPNAITDGDSIVYFRFSDVIVTGDVFTTGPLPDDRHREGRHRSGRASRG